ncbi:DUF4344 domain-containing metallopeptidase [Leptolyngbya sp. 7M]|uniref:DUF4344 domain-containing metallopeptidase n=1 Tax=Leptolyngbya sp. 7M TaxID=2812896 RepID=UPI001B8CA4E3|nr:DUF4344 domain-containing metallopeptidase [Leptolyngbya sp. 7M]QYO65342.1 DUF4344 domain-containing metallopeptidase [Leptolyngbya sp. 7M]
MGRNLTNLIIAIAALALVAGCFCRSDRQGRSFPIDDPPSNTARSSTPQEERRSSSKPDNGDFIVEHLDVTTPRYVEIDEQVKKERLLPDAAERLNRALSLPHDIFLRTKDCKEVNAFYDPRERSITMCYELMEYFYKTFKSDGRSDDESWEKMFAAVRFVFLHEIGHALIDAYKLPIMGGEEDAADRCSAFINLKELGEEGVDAVFAAAEAFAIESRRSSSSRRNLADEHLLSEQRFYNSLCMIYGSNPTKYSRILTEGMLPKERALRCPNEFQKTVDSWMSLLEPWRKK